MFYKGLLTGMTDSLSTRGFTRLKDRSFPLFILIPTIRRDFPRFIARSIIVISEASFLI